MARYEAAPANTSRNETVGRGSLGNVVGTVTDGDLGALPVGPLQDRLDDTEVLAAVGTFR